MPHYRRNPQVDEAPLQHELMLYHAQSSQFFMLNPTMAYIWRHCESQSVDGLISGITNDFDGTDATSAGEDVRQAINELVSLGLIVDATPPSV